MEERARKYAIIAAVAVAGIAAIVMAITYSQPKNISLDMGKDNPAPAQTGGLAVPNAGSEELSEKAPDQVIPSAISVSPTTVSAGGQATVTGNGFTPGSPITLFLDNSRISEGKIAADQSGTFSTTVSLPEIKRGEHNINAQDGSGKAAIAVLSVK